MTRAVGVACAVQIQRVFQQVFADGDTLFAEPGKKQAGSDMDFVLALLHLAFRLLSDPSPPLRESGMLMYRELMLRRNLRGVFLIDMPGKPGEAATNDFKADLYTACFDKLVSGDKDVKRRDPLLHAAAFDAFQKHLARLSPQFRTYVAVVAAPVAAARARLMCARVMCARVRLTLCTGLRTGVCSVRLQCDQPAPVGRVERLQQQGGRGWRGALGARAIPVDRLATQAAVRRPRRWQGVCARACKGSCGCAASTDH